MINKKAKIAQIGSNYDHKILYYERIEMPGGVNYKCVGISFIVLRNSDPPPNIWH
jgi:hypothetical protein